MTAADIFIVFLVAAFLYFGGAIVGGSLYFLFRPLVRAWWWLFRWFAHPRGHE